MMSSFPPPPPPPPIFFPTLTILCGHQSIDTFINNPARLGNAPPFVCDETLQTIAALALHMRCECYDDNKCACVYGDDDVLL